MSTLVNIHYGNSVKSLTSHCINPIISFDEKETPQEKYLDWIGKFGVGLMTAYSYSHLTMKVALGEVAKATVADPDSIRKKFSQIIDVFSAVSEPILWGFAIVGLVLVATGNKQMGWARVKNVAYAYISIQCLPAFFAFLRYVSKMLTDAFTGM